MNQGEQGTDKPLDTKLVNKRLEVQVLITQPLTHHFLFSLFQPTIGGKKYLLGILVGTEDVTLVQIKLFVH